MNTNTTKSVEQLRAEAAAAAEALAAAEAAAKRASEEAAAAEKAAKELARRTAALNAPQPAWIDERAKHLEAIANTLLGQVEERDAGCKTAPKIGPHIKIEVEKSVRTVREEPEGPVVNWSAPLLNITLHGQKVYTQLEFKAEMEASHGRFSFSRPRTTGRMRLTVGSYGDRVSLPSKKDGSFNYAAVASKIFSDVLHSEEQYQKAVVLAKNKALAPTLRKEFGLGEYSSVIEEKRSVQVGGRYDSYAAPVGHVYLKLDKAVTPEQARAILNAAIEAGVKLS